MHAFGRGVIQFFDRLFALAVILAQILLVGMVLLISANVFMRYVLNSGIFWAEEISLVMAVWFSFIAMALGVRKNLHISIHLFRNPPGWLDKVFNVLTAVAELLLGYVLLRYGVILVQFTSRSIMPATELPSSVLYLILPFSAVLILYEAVTDLFGYDNEAGTSDSDSVFEGDESDA
jgi:TRAP-type C4-dicarboxylate transport system permease small subunit